MKKIFSVFIALCLCVPMFLVGCGKKKEAGKGDGSGTNTAAITVSQVKDVVDDAKLMLTDAYNKNKTEISQTTSTATMPSDNFLNQFYANIAEETLTEGHVETFSSVALMFVDSIQSSLNFVQNFDTVYYDENETNGLYFKLKVISEYVAEIDYFSMYDDSEYSNNINISMTWIVELGHDDIEYRLSGIMIDNKTNTQFGYFTFSKSAITHKLTNFDYCLCVFNGTLETLLAKNALTVDDVPTEFGFYEGGLFNFATMKEKEADKASIVAACSALRPYLVEHSELANNESKVKCNIFDLVA